LSDHWKELYGDRVAAREEGGQLPHEQAEALALQDTLAAQQRAEAGLSPVRQALRDLVDQAGHLGQQLAEVPDLSPALADQALAELRRLCGQVRALTALVDEATGRLPEAPAPPETPAAPAAGTGGLGRLKEVVLQYLHPRLLICVSAAKIAQARGEPTDAVLAALESLEREGVVCRVGSDPPYPEVWGRLPAPLPPPAEPCPPAWPDDKGLKSALLTFLRCVGGRPALAAHAAREVHERDVDRALRLLEELEREGKVRRVGGVAWACPPGPPETPANRAGHEFSLHAMRATRR
jgi:hypothetical protein